MSPDPEDLRGLSGRSQRKKEVLRYGLLFLIGLLTLWFLLTRIEVDRLIIDQLNWWYALPVLLLTLTAYAVRTFFFTQALPGHPVPPKAHYLVTGLYSFLAILFPLGLGHLSYPFLLNRHFGVPVSEGVSVMIGFNALRVLALCLVFFLTLPALEIIGGGVQSLPGWIALLGLAWGLAFGSLFALRGKRLPLPKGRIRDFATRSS